MKKTGKPNLKSKHFLLIAALCAAVILPIVILAVFAAPKSAAYPENVTVNDTVYSYRDFLKGCILEQLKSLDEPPTDADAAGINAAGAAIHSSIVYLYGINGLSRDCFPCVKFMSEKECAEHFGENAERYISAADCAADYALCTRISYNGRNVFLPVCRISSGALTDPADAGLDMPWLKKLYCPRDKYAAGYSGGCQLTSGGLSQILLAKYPDIVLPPETDSRISDIRTDGGGNVLSLAVCGINMSGYEFCRMFGIRSVCFEMTCSQGLYTFTTKGDGDSIGMSVYAAVQMSRSGSNEKEILNTFYNADVEEIR